MGPEIASVAFFSTLLEDLQIVQRHIVLETPPWVEYELTQRGHELARALTPIAACGREHLTTADQRTDHLAEQPATQTQP